MPSKLFTFIQLIFTFDIFIFKVQTLPAGAQIIGQHIQQDPSDPSKWQVVQSINTTSTPAPPPLQPGGITVVNTSSTPGPATTPDPLSGDVKVKVRRVACTCPNCSEGERYDNNLIKSVVFTHIS